MPILYPQYSCHTATCLYFHCFIHSSLVIRSQSLDFTIQSCLVMKTTWLFHSILNFPEVLILSSSLVLSGRPNISPSLVKKAWFFLPLLTCHDWIDSFIQDYLVMKTWLSLSVLTSHEALNLTSSLVLSRRPDSSILSYLALKALLFLPDSQSRHEDLTLPPVSASHEVMNLTSLKGYTQSCQLQLDYHK